MHGKTITLTKPTLANEGDAGETRIAPGTYPVLAENLEAVVLDLGDGARAIVSLAEV